MVTRAANVTPAKVRRFDKSPRFAVVIDVEVDNVAAVDACWKTVLGLAITKALVGNGATLI